LPLPHCYRERRFASRRSGSLKQLIEMRGTENSARGTENPVRMPGQNQGVRTRDPALLIGREERGSGRPIAPIEVQLAKRVDEAQ